MYVEYSTYRFSGGLKGDGVDSTPQPGSSGIENSVFLMVSVVNTMLLMEIFWMTLFKTKSLRNICLID